MRGLLGRALKDNPDLERSVITGILRIAKESIFSDPNNLTVCSLLGMEFQDCFGFTEAEVERLIADFAAPQGEDIKRWYNGYRFGTRIIYNPWSVLSFLHSADRKVMPYWINTGSDDLLRRLLTRTEPAFQARLETLLAGGTIITPLNENTVLRDLDEDDITIWSLLVFSGYLKPVDAVLQDDEWLYELAIPNREVHAFYRNTLRTWIRQAVGGSGRLQDLLDALLQTDWSAFGALLQEMVVAVLSYHDTAGNEPEQVYHAFVLGMLTHLSGRYHIRSNRESGYGRYDVLMIPRAAEATGFVFAFKKVRPPENNEIAMQNALQQIREREYVTDLREQGVKTVWGVGVVVAGKKVWVESLVL